MKHVPSSVAPQETNPANNGVCSDFLEDYLHGQLREDQVSLVEEHLTHCPTCIERLSRLAAPESFWNETSSHLKTAQLDELTKPLTDEVVEPDDKKMLGFPLAPTDDPNMMGRIGPYEVCGEVGRGGMGIVLKGWDRSLDRYVAIKVMQPAFSHQSAARQRFAREAKAAAGVVHDNVIAIYSVDQYEETPYLVMPYVKGESLQRRIERLSPLTIEEMLEIGLQMARGLQAAHDKGLVHRDIKPANILLPQSVSRVVITDFGLARAVDDAAMTTSGVIAGTPSYMSPEQVRGLPCDGRSDLFSLGCTLYAMACGHPPFRAESSFAVMNRIANTPHRPLSSLRSDIPHWFDSIVDRLLEKKAVNRFTNAGELADHLESCLSFVRQPRTQSLPKLPMNRARYQSRLLMGVGLVGAFIAFMVIATITWAIFQTLDNSFSKRQDTKTHVHEDLSLDEILQNQLDRIERDIQQLNQEIENDNVH